MSHDNDDPGERARVYSKIAPLIMAYYNENTGRAFHAEDLRRYVLDQAPEIAPASPDRILRLLRQEGRLYYVVIERGNSLYQFRSLAERNWAEGVEEDDDDE